MDSTELTKDAVHFPAHYARWQIEPIRFAVENFGPGILVFSINKYLMRYDSKHKSPVEDLAKALRFTRMLIRFTARDPEWWKPETDAQAKQSVMDIFEEY